MAWRVANSLGATGKDGLLGEINASAPKRNKDDDGAIGDSQHSARTSDHNPCDCHQVVCARDFTHDPKGGFDAHRFADWLARRIADGTEKRVKYVISNRRIASGPNQGHPIGEWRKYTGSNPHTKHCHVSVRHGPEFFDDKKPWWWAALSPIPTPTAPIAPKTCPSSGYQIKPWI